MSGRWHLSFALGLSLAVLLGCAPKQAASEKTPKPADTATAAEAPLQPAAGGPALAATPVDAAPSPALAVEEVAPPPNPAAPSRWGCVADGDCLTSCHFGAVSAAWYAAQVDFVECEGGCTNQLAEPARCIDGECVAFQHDPSDETKIERSDHCTKKR